MARLGMMRLLLNWPRRRGWLGLRVWGRQRRRCLRPGLVFGGWGRPVCRWSLGRYRIGIFAWPLPCLSPICRWERLGNSRRARGRTEFLRCVVELGLSGWVRVWRRGDFCWISFSWRSWWSSRRWIAAGWARVRRCSRDSATWAPMRASLPTRSTRTPETRKPAMPRSEVCSFFPALVPGCARRASRNEASGADS
jgi:hypothetical protein